MRESFEGAATSLIKVDHYKRSSRASDISSNRKATVSAMDYLAGRDELGVDLRWRHPKKFAKLTNDQKDELMNWLRSDYGKKHREEQKR